MEDSKDKFRKKEKEKFLVNTLTLSPKFQSGGQPSIQFHFLFSLFLIAFQIYSTAHKLLRQ